MDTTLAPPLSSASVALIRLILNCLSQTAPQCSQTWQEIQIWTNKKIDSSHKEKMLQSQDINSPTSDLVAEIS